MPKKQTNRFGESNPRYPGLLGGSVKKRKDRSNPFRSGELYNKAAGITGGPYYVESKF